MLYTMRYTYLEKEGNEVTKLIIDSSHKHDYYRHEEITQDKITSDYF